MDGRAGSPDNDFQMARRIDELGTG